MPLGDVVVGRDLVGEHPAALRQSRPGGLKVCGSLGLLYRRLPKSNFPESRSLEGLGIDGNLLPPVKGLDLGNHRKA